MQGSQPAWPHAARRPTCGLRLAALDKALSGSDATAAAHPPACTGCKQPHREARMQASSCALALSCSGSHIVRGSMASTVVASPRALSPFFLPSFGCKVRHSHDCLAGNTRPVPFCWSSPSRGPLSPPSTSPRASLSDHALRARPGRLWPAAVARQPKRKHLLVTCNIRRGPARRAAAACGVCCRLGPAAWQSHVHQTTHASSPRSLTLSCGSQLEASHSTRPSVRRCPRGLLTGSATHAGSRPRETDPCSARA
jgi:hypothetical protein